ncbi:uncharacterized protein N7443_006958 [Penicillium atrosanguineum]|uniref:uncharacterized protein n=1 Tax=Penicillium atrosanguineum TaxID=1132637 RepID=UPI0023869BED|nr:uncharacterized protein N7443_006958 [Penicillium atrosanguineum]KAJ5298838.1 hypothetical protein N7443_006958 [Penicillium atrosanguineum]
MLFWYEVGVGLGECETVVKLATGVPRVHIYGAMVDHAVVPAEHWERELHTAGFGHVDWTDGSLPENAFQKVIIALKSGAQGPRLPKPAALPEPIPELNPANIETRTAGAERLVSTYSNGWATSKLHFLGAKKGMFS